MGPSIVVHEPVITKALWTSALGLRVELLAWFWEDRGTAWIRYQIAIFRRRLKLRGDQGIFAIPWAFVIIFNYVPVL